MPESYTDAEIVELYRRGKSDRRIIKKLCDLSCKPREEVLTILHAAGEALPETPDREKKAHGLRISDEVWRKIIADRLNGASTVEICDTYHVCKSAAGNWRRKAKALGIPLPDHQITSGIQCIPDKIRKEVEQMEEKKAEMEKLMPLPLDEKRTPSGIIRNFTYFMEPYDDAPYKAEYVDGAVELHAVIPVKEAAV